MKTPANEAGHENRCLVLLCHERTPGCRTRNGGPAADYTFRSVELKAVSLRVDGVFEPALDESHVYEPQAEGLPYLFAEAQMQKDQGFYFGWLAKVYLYLRQHPVMGDYRLLVLFKDRSCEPKTPRWLEGVIASGRLARVYLENLPEFPESPIELALLKLATSPLVALPQKAKELAAQVHELRAPKVELFELLEMLLVVNLPDLTRAEIQKMLQIPELRESRLYQDAMAEGIAKGKQEGLREAVLKLKAKGKSAKEVAELLDLDLKTVRAAFKSSSEG